MSMPTEGTWCHIEIPATDPGTAKKFYGEVFGWSFQPWGPPEFWLIKTGSDTDPGIHGSLQRRQNPASDGIRSFECTISVESVDAISKAIENSGGRIVMRKYGDSLLNSSKYTNAGS